MVLNLYERDGVRAFDSSPVIDADGRLLGTTRMLHIAQMPHFYEQEYYTPGDHGMPVYDTAVGRIGVAICYDRHYPEVMRSLGLQRADLVVVPQAGMAGEWPDGLYEAELRVAAFQNGYFTALANRVGDEPGMTFAGESFVCDPAGRVMVARACRRRGDRVRGPRPGATRVMPRPPVVPAGPETRARAGAAGARWQLARVTCVRVGILNPEPRIPSPEPRRREYPDGTRF